MAEPDDREHADATAERVLEAAAAGVADEAQVDWGARAALSPPAASRLQKLQLIESLGRAFRAAAPSGPESAPRGGPAANAQRTWSHLRLISKLGEGSFGEVYRAHDPILERDVALKLSKSAPVTGDERRFLDEARRLAKVRHPNVVAVHGAELHDGRVGLWTDLVEGETLEQLLARHGRLPPREAAAIGVDLCRALSAVHAQGLVHGDVKASNVMRDRDGRVVLMDFGTVKEVSPHGDVVVTRGTPVVLAPELLRGEPPTAAADVYSLGVLLYQLVSGRRPIEGASVAEILARHAEGPPRPVRDVRSGVPPELARVIEQALDGDPRRRPAGAAAMERMLAPHTEAARGRRTWTLPAAVLGVAIAGAGALLAPHPGRPATSPRTSVAVLGFKNLSERAADAWMGTALGEMLSTELAAGQGLRVVPGEQVARARVEMALADGDRMTPETLRRVRGILGAEFLALGSYVAVGGEAGSVRVDVRLQDAGAGETIAAISETGTESELFDIVARIGARLRARLAAGDGGPPAPSAARASLPDGRDAARLYAEGLARMRLFDLAEARDLLEKAVAAEPGFAPAHSALAAVFAALGQDGRARQSAERAFQLAAGLGLEERATVEAGFREVTHEWERAIDIYRSLRARYPDDLEHGLRLAAAQTAGGRPKDALSTVTELRRLPPLLAQDARIDLEEASAAYALTDYRRAQAAAARAAEKGQARGARLLLARARLHEGASWASMNERPAALAAATEAERLFAQAGDEMGAARTAYLMSSILWDQGDVAGAERAVRHALSMFQERGAGTGTAQAMDRLGDLLRDQGRLEEAEACFQQVLPLQRELGNATGEASALHSIGVVRYARGQLASAKTSFEQALEISRRIGSKAYIAYHLNSIANILLETGEPAAAFARYEEALALARASGLRTGAALYLNNIGDGRLLVGEPRLARAAHEEALTLSRAINTPARIVRSLGGLANTLAAQGDLTAARALLAESLAVLEPMKEGTALASARQALAEVAIEQGQWAEAVALLRPADEEFRRQKRAGGEAGTAALLAQASFMAGDRRSGEAALQRARELLPSIDSRDQRGWVTSIIERVRVTSAVPPARSCAAEPALGARRALAAAARDAREAGYATLTLQARLALAEVELVCGRVSSARAGLAAVQKEARARGLTLLADKAAQASR